MSDRRFFLGGLAALPIAGSSVATSATTIPVRTIFSTPIDPFPGYHREVLDLLNQMEAEENDSDEVFDRVMDR